jgi:hypothetical protein
MWVTTLVEIAKRAAVTVTDATVPPRVESRTV